VASYDHYIFCAMNRGWNSPNVPANLARIDLSNPTHQDLRFAWAPFTEAGIATGDGHAISAMVVGRGVLYYAVQGDGLYGVDLKYDSIPGGGLARVPSGFITSGRIRFNTLEEKLFRYLRVLSDALVGSIDAQVLYADGTASSVVTFNTQGAIKLAEMPLSGGPQDWVQVKLTLRPVGVGEVDTPVVTGYQLKALPATKNQRLLLVTLSCFDKETDRTGNRVSGDAMARLHALEALEESRDIVQFQDLNRPDGSNDRQVVIDEVDFIQTAPPEGQSGFGGFIRATLRTVD